METPCAIISVVVLHALIVSRGESSVSLSDMPKQAYVCARNLLDVLHGRI